MVELHEDNIVVKKVEGGSIIGHAPLFSENGRLVIKKYTMLTISFKCIKYKSNINYLVICLTKLNY